MSLQTDDSALRLPGTTARHEPSEADWEKLRQILSPHFTDGLFTVLQVDKAWRLVRRAYSSNPDAYRTGGTKELMGTPWARHVIDEGRCFIAFTAAEMEAAFADHRALSEIGCTTAMNIPLRQGIDVAWTVNLLRGGAIYTPAESLTVKSKIKRWIAELYPHRTPPGSL
jgi:hypothetical protein